MSEERMSDQEMSEFAGLLVIIQNKVLLTLDYIRGKISAADLRKLDKKKVEEYDRGPGLENEPVPARLAELYRLRRTCKRDGC
jgi:hypothetical protein